MSYSYSKEQKREISEKGDTTLNILSKKWERTIVKVIMKILKKKLNF